MTAELQAVLLTVSVGCLVLYVATGLMFARTGTWVGAGMVAGAAGALALGPTGTALAVCLPLMTIGLLLAVVSWGGER